MEDNDLAFVRIPSDSPFRQSWNRFKNADRMVIHWEAKGRPGGAIVEEILDVSPRFDVGEHIIVLTTDPTHEDVVYFSELGIKRIIRIRNREKERAQAAAELKHHLLTPVGRDNKEKAWLKVLRAIDTLPPEAPITFIEKLDKTIERLRDQTPSARYLDASASIAFRMGDPDRAHKLWMSALDRNPNYYRTYHNLIAFHRHTGKNSDAMALMQKMQELNKANISRLVGMGELQMETEDEARAEFYFKSALDRDQQCAGALNGLAEIRFHQGDLEESRRLLAKSHLAYKAAANLNKLGSWFSCGGAPVQTFTRLRCILQQTQRRFTCRVSFL
jgi:tetratricopeptide (TPR) repeat protein